MLRCSRQAQAYLEVHRVFLQMPWALEIGGGRR